MSRRQAEKPVDMRDVTKILIGGIVTGMALAIGGEAWQWVSPMKRRERNLAESEPDYDVGDLDIDEVEG